MAYVRGVVSGRLTKDLSLVKTSNGTSVLSFSLAVDRRQAEGQQQTADFFSCVAWKGTADFLSSYAHKGDTVTAEFRLQNRSYKNKNGQDVHVTELVCDNIIAITPKRGSTQQSTQPNQMYGQQAPMAAAPAPAPAPQPAMQPAQQTPYPAYTEPDFSGEDFGI